ncbi:MAG: carboxymuconolactone decarboxylase family protein [Candidimonas sp.]|jgi:alkylhydroperoxidase family enzyme
MARIPYPDLDSADVKPLVQQIVNERGKLQNLYRLLLNSPPVAQGWLNFLTAIRQKCELDGGIRELTILRIAILNSADYEFISHVPYALKAGLRQAQIDAVSNWQDSAEFSQRERDVLNYVDAVTRDVQVADTIFEPLKKQFSAREMTELTATIAAYNLVSRFLVALEVDPEPDEART